MRSECKSSEMRTTFGIDRPFEPPDVAILDGVLHIDDVAIEAVGLGVRP